MVLNQLRDQRCSYFAKSISTIGIYKYRIDHTLFHATVPSLSDYRIPFLEQLGGLFQARLWDDVFR